MSLEREPVTAEGVAGFIVNLAIAIQESDHSPLGHPASSDLLDRLGESIETMIQGQERLTIQDELCIRTLYNLLVSDVQRLKDAADQLS